MSTPHSHKSSVAAARRAMPDLSVVSDMAETFKVLGDPNRLRIVIAVSHAELCTADIALAVGMTESAVSHQLRLLKALRLIRQRKEGKLVLTSLNDEHIEDLLRIAGRHSTEAM